MKDLRPDPAARTRASYDAIAERFLERTSDRSGLAVALDRFAARVGPGGLALDVGGGPGADASELRRRGLRVITLDLSLGMLRAGERVHPGPRVQADMARLPFGRIADGIWLNASLLHVERARVPTVLAELRSALRATGVLHVSVKQGARDGWETARYGDAHPRWFSYWTPDALDAELAAADFRILAAEAQPGSDVVWLVRLCAPIRAQT